MKDWLGNEFTVGDLVVYAAASGSSITMVLAKVLEIRRVYRNDDWEWVTLKDEEEAPFLRKWDHELKDYVDRDEREETQHRVKVRPIRCSRWKQHYGRTRYIDKRNGKGIDIFLRDKEGFFVHREGGYFENIHTGERVSDYSRHSDYRFHGYRYWDSASIPTGWKRVEARDRDYVERVDEPTKSVTLTITDNIVKWNGEVNDL